MALFPDIDMPISVGAAFGADPVGDPGGWTFTDLSSRLLDVPMVKRVGRSAGAKTTDAKSCTLTLDNDDGALTPLNAESVNWPYVVLDVPMFVKIDPLDTGDVAWFEGFAASWQLDVIATTEGTTAVVRVTLAGVLRRLQKGDTPLRSALYTSMAGVAAGDYIPHAYWSLEDGANANQFASGLAGGTPMTLLAGANLASDDSLAGSLPLPVFSGSAYATAPVPAYADTGQWVAQIAVRVADSGPSLGVSVISVETANGKIAAGIDVVTDNLVVATFDTAGVLTATYVDPIANMTLVADAWASLALTSQADVSGSNDGITATLLTPAGEIIASVSEVVGASIHAAARRVNINGSTPGIGAGGSLGHVGLFVDPAFSIGADEVENALAMSGWAGELASDRVERLCRENRIPVTITGTSTITMGPQSTDTFLANVQACELADGGSLVEDGYGLGLVCLSARVNRTPDFTINMATYATTRGTQQQVWQPIFDAERYRNDWTISRPDGVTVVADDASTTKYKDSDEVLVETDDQVADQAWWRYYRDSVTAYRWPAIPVDLAANPALIEDWLALVPGLSKMRRTNPPPQHPSGDIDEMVDGWSETLSRRRWSGSVVASPAEPYTVIELDDAATAKLDTEGCVLHTAVNSSVTSWDVATTSGPLWSTDNAEDGFDWRIGGERVTVTDIAASTVSTIAIGLPDTHANNASVTPSLPSSVAAGNLLLILAAIRNSGTGIPNTPSGYTRLAIFEAASNIQVFAKIAGSSETAPTVSFSGGVANATTTAQMLRMNGKWHDVANILLSAASCLNASAQDITYPGLSLPEADNCVILYVGWKQDVWTSVASPGTEINEAASGLGDDQGTVWAYQVQTTAAYVPSGTFVVTGGGAAISRGAVAALRCDYQTATVTRSLNGVVKSHSAGADIRLWTPARWAL